ncbi:MAG: lysophospholipid acyltransferase [Thelocarpon impressellum]|nr:MAG: lysophospholipid acyltransferase [Thelocarpon impressellum]
MLPYIDYPFEYAGSFLGTSVDELKLITSFLLSYPLAGLLKRIPDARPAYKNLFIVGVSLFYLVGLFDMWTGLQTLLIAAGGAYAIATFIDGPFMPWVAFASLMGHLAINHIARQAANTPTVVDVTGAQMVMVMKFFFPSLFAGPAFDYVEYQRWIETTMFDVPPGTDPTMKPRTRKQRKIPRSGTPATLKAITGLLWILAFLKFSSWFSTELVLSDQYLQYGLLRRVWILHMFGFTARLKYYGVWALTEGACILSGLGYKGVDPKTGRVQWDRLQNVAPWPLETAQNTRAYLENWNMNTNNWLRNYMYLRVTPKGKKPGFRASMATFVTSAFWHGFYPGYYLTFVLASFLQTIAKTSARLTYAQYQFPSPDASMRGVQVEKAGAPFTIVDGISKPTPAADQILVKSIVASINPIDTVQQAYGILVVSWPIVLGCDAGGVVVEVGKDAGSSFKVGDEVCGCTRLGTPGHSTLQEYFLMDAPIAMPKPKNISIAQASTLGVGTYLVKSLGADATFDYKLSDDEQFQTISSITSGKFPGIFDAIGKAIALSVRALDESSLSSTKHFTTTDSTTPMPTASGVKTNRILLGPIGRGPEAIAGQPTLNKDLESYIKFLVPLVESGKLRPNEVEVVGTTGFEGALEAIQTQQKGASAGAKIAVKLQDP